ncbi:MAG: M23 family metallopeptidase [Gammaproteobacteria bacterium]|nr:M23 family metallopeptidase [Gammaproteobacteria bacterium]MYC51825.1 M23 family metallopeptidase [Gammaproteobacteria bacterium]
MAASSRNTRQHRGVWIGLAGLLLTVVLGLAFLALREPPLPELAPVEVSWEPAPPVQGHLFLIRVTAPAVDGMVSAAGEAGGEELHFQPRATDSATPRAATAGGEEGLANTMLVSLAPVPIGATDSIDAWVTASYADGRTQTDSLRIAIVGGEYEHERLTVAPRFGSPLGEEDQARLRSDQAKANQVAREAHATPRLWSPEVVLPRDSRVTSGFGTGRVFNGQISSRHMGLDLAGFPGDTVRAAADGVVALVDGFLLAGGIVYLNHGAGLLTGYFHLSGQLVEAGDTVTAGTPIGLVGATGRVTGPHLHWVVRYGTTTVDPLSLLALSGI